MYNFIFLVPQPDRGKSTIVGENKCPAADTYSGDTHVSPHDDSSANPSDHSEPLPATSAAGDTASSWCVIS